MLWRPQEVADLEVGDLYLKKAQIFVTLSCD